VKKITTAKIRTLPQFEKAWDIFKDQILSRNIDDFDTSTNAKNERINKSKKDFDYFKRIYFPEYFNDDPAPFHKEWNKIREIKNELVLVEASRGFGKSTDFTFVDIIYRALFDLSRFSVVVSYSEDKAKIFTGKILLELLYNRKIRNDFDIKFFRKSLGNIQFSLKNDEIQTEHCIKAFSIGQNVRGEVFYNNRPDTVRLDDIQDRRRAKSKKFVNNCLEWIHADLIPALDPKNFSAIIVATPMNARCVVSELKSGNDEEERSPVRYFSFPAVKNNKSTWEARFPLERLETLRKSTGTLLFNQEYLLIPMSLEEKVFKKEWIKYYDTLPILKYIITFTDPSLTSKGDYKATVCLGSDGKDIYVLKARVRRESVSKMLDGLYSIYNAFNPQLMFFEDYSANDDNQTILQESIEIKATEKGYNLPLKPKRNSINKNLRIEGTLSSELENGKILFDKDDPDQKIIVDQIVDFPECKNDDGIDSLEGGVREMRERIRVGNKNKNMKPPTVRRRKTSVTSGY